MNFTKEELDVMPVPDGKVVFLGSNPSCSSPYNDPFSHCKSASKILAEWIPALGLKRDQVYFMNVANYKTQGNRPLKVKEWMIEVPRIIELTKGKVVVTRGKTALEVMCEVVENWRFTPEENDNHTPIIIAMPHPSGRNRLLNDKAWVAATLAGNKKRLQEVFHTPQ